MNIELFSKLTLGWFDGMLIAQFIQYFLYMLSLGPLGIENLYDRFYKHPFKTVASRGYLISVIVKVIIFVIICIVTGAFSNLGLVVDGKVVWKTLLEYLVAGLFIDYTFRWVCFTMYTVMRPGL